MSGIYELNHLSEREFAEALRPLFEAAGPLAQALYAERPFASYVDLLDRAETLASQFPIATQIEVVNAHPRIGESAVIVKKTSAQSYREQGYDAESSVPPGELQRIYTELAELNRQYEARFGFRFVVFVAGRPKSAIVNTLRQRLANARDAELQTALDAMFLIARDRFARLGRED
jgi:OHCU decarboxylase